MAYDGNRAPQSPIQGQLDPYIPVAESCNTPWDAFYDYYTQDQIIDQAPDEPEIVALSGSSLGSLPPTPCVDETPQGTQEDSGPSPPENDTKTWKRRIQNREAQRRFRERKEEFNKLLQQRAQEIRKDYESLYTEHTKALAKLSHLAKANESLRSEIGSLCSEVKDLRQQKRMMLTILGLLQQSSKSPAESGLPAEFFDRVMTWLGDFTEDLAGHDTR